MEQQELSEEQSEMLRKWACPTCGGFCPCVGIEDEREWQTPDGNFCECTQIYECQDCGANFYQVTGN